MERGFPSISSGESFTRREIEILGLIAEGCSNQDIADKLFISLTTVKWYNTQVYTKLGATSRMQAIHKARAAGLTLNQADLSRTVHAAPKHNLPAAVDAFIARQDDLVRLKTCLATRRLVTLTGPGGVGKTRLALQVGWELREVFVDGICMVNLAATRETSLVMHAIAAALGLNEIPGRGITDRLRGHLAQKEMLLILDNFEQVLDAGPQVYDLLEVCPNLSILVTSRESLHLSGEQVYSLNPLRVAPPSRTSLSDGRNQSSEAMQFFEQQAQSVQPDFRLTAENAPAVQAICRRLEGFPLAIKLAAAHLRLFNLHALLAHLDHRLGLLVGGARNLPRRQQTMRTSIEWSYALLTPAEQALFQRLAVFAGGCTMEAARSVASSAAVAGSTAECSGDDMSVLEGIESLLDKHLLFSREVNGETRFDMFETLREFALERLESSGEAPAVYQCFAEYYGALVDRFYNRITLLEPEIDNFRAAMRWSIDTGHAAAGLRIAGNDWFWTEWNSEWRFWLESLLNSPSAQAELPLQEAALWHLLFQALIEGDVVRCQQRLDEYETVVKEMDSLEWQPVVFYLKGFPRIMLQDYEGALTVFGQALKIYEELGFQFWAALSHGGLGQCLLLLGQFDRAEASLQTCLRLLKDDYRDTPMLRPEILASLGYTALEKGDLRGAQERFRKSLREASVLGYKSGYADCLDGLAALSQQQGNRRQAARLYSAVQALAGTAGLLSHKPALKILNQRYLATLRQGMDPAELEQAWQEGQTMTLDEAMQAGLEIEVPPVG